MRHAIADIQFQGVKSFSGPQSFSLKPLTLVFGANGAGKSTLVRLPLLLLASVRSGVQGLDLCAGGVEHGARVADLFPAKGGVSTLRFEVGLRQGEGPLLRVGAELRRETERAMEQLRVIRTQRGSESVDLGFDLTAPTALLGWAPASWAPDLLSSMQRGAEAIVHLGPFRSRPATVFPIPTDPIGGLGHLGEGAPNILAADRLWGKGVLIDRVNDWYRRTFGISIRVEAQGARAYLLLADLPESGSVPFAALGSGMTQSLAAVVALAMGAEQPGRLICLEEPELHLHPGAHAPLGQLLVDTAKAGRSTVLVETHSENLLLRVRRAVVSGELSREELGLYWVDRRGNDSAVRELHIDEDGFVPDWPHGVFQEDALEAREISKLLRARWKS